MTIYPNNVATDSSTQSPDSFYLLRPCSRVLENVFPTFSTAYILVGVSRDTVHTLQGVAKFTGVKKAAYK